MTFQARKWQARMRGPIPGKDQGRRQRLFVLEACMGAGKSRFTPRGSPRYFWGIEEYEVDHVLVLRALAVNPR